MKGIKNPSAGLNGHWDMKLSDFLHGLNKDLSILISVQSENNKYRCLFIYYYYYIPLGHF